jgi:hypothetical protein
VREITYFPSGVMVKTEDNKVYRADYVMISVSLGVLQTDLIRFRPQLPVSSFLYSINCCYSLIYKSFQSFQFVGLYKIKFIARPGRSSQSTSSTWRCTPRSSSSSPRNSGLKDLARSSSSMLVGGGGITQSGR